MTRQASDVINTQNPCWDRHTRYPDLWPIRPRDEVQKHKRHPNPMITGIERERLEATKLLFCSAKKKEYRWMNMRFMNLNAKR